MTPALRVRCHGSEMHGIQNMINTTFCPYWQAKSHTTAWPACRPSVHTTSDRWCFPLCCGVAKAGQSVRHQRSRLQCVHQPINILSAVDPYYSALVNPQGPAIHRPISVRSDIRSSLSSKYHPQRTLSFQISYSPEHWANTTVSLESLSRDTPHIPRAVVRWPHQLSPHRWLRDLREICLISPLHHKSSGSISQQTPRMSLVLLAGWRQVSLAYTSPTRS